MVAWEQGVSGKVRGCTVKEDGGEVVKLPLGPEGHKGGRACRGRMGPYVGAGEGERGRGIQGKAWSHT